MGLAKRIGKSTTLRGLLCRLTAAYIRLVHATSRWRVEGGDIPARFWDQNKPFILAFWHGRILMMAKCWPDGVAISMLTSQHRDGRLIAQTVEPFGIGTIAGSTTRGGGAALRAMVKALRAGECIGLTPDGPKGPRMRANAGVVNVAKLSGCPIIPVTYSARRSRLLSSWDRFLLPPLFTKGVFLWGEPITVPKDADEAALEAARAEVERILIELCDRADTMMGVETVPPA